jgi:hypothetical protein
MLAGLMTLGAASLALGDDDENVNLDDLPAAVKATILKEANGATIKEIEREKGKDGKIVYEAEWIENGKEVEITVAEDGTLLEREEEDADDDADDDDGDDIDDADDDD